MASRRARLVAGLLALAAVGCGDAATNDDCSRSTASYGCLDRFAQPRPAPPLGVNTHYGGSRDPVDREAFRRLRALGVSFVRNDVEWAAIERARGVYDFESSGYDAVVAAAEEAGLRILLLLDYGNPLYGPARAVLDDSGRAAYAAFAGAVAERYGGRGHRFEIWNEPNLPQFWSEAGTGPDAEAYAQLVAATSPAIRAADPSAEVLIGAVFMGLPEVIPRIGGIAGQEFVTRLLGTGVGALADGLTVHLYRGGPPETAAQDVEQLRATIAASGLELPLWSGEWGYSTYDPNAPPTGLNYLPAVSLERHASWIARMVLGNRALGLAGSVLFKDRDAREPDPGNIEDHFGLMHGDLTPKPAYDALRALNGLVGEAPMVGALRLGAGEHAIVFEATRSRRERVVALWAESPAAWDVDVRRGVVRIVARDGRDVTPPEMARGERARLALAADEGPVYVIGDAAFAPAAESTDP